MRAKEFTSEADMTRRDFLKRVAATTAAAGGVGSTEADYDSEEARIAADPNWMPLYKDGVPVTDLPGRIVPGDQAGPGPGQEEQRWDDPESSVMQFYKLKQQKCADISGTWDPTTNSCTQGALGNKNVKTTW